jgi:hypothetical protein
MVSVHGAFATDSLSLRKLPKPHRILPIVPAKNKHSQEKITGYLGTPSNGIKLSISSS